MTKFPIFLSTLMLILATNLSAATKEDYQRAESYWNKSNGLTDHRRLEAKWINEGNLLWYISKTSFGKKYILITPETKEKKVAFDHNKLSALLKEKMNQEIDSSKLPISNESFSNSADEFMFSAFNKNWKFIISNNELIEIEKSENKSPRNGNNRQRRENRNEDASIVLKDHNVFIKKSNNDEEIQLTTNGNKNQDYSRFILAPNKKSAIVYITTPGKNNKLFRIESSPNDGIVAKLHTSDYDRPGDKIDSNQMYAVDIENESIQKINIPAFEIDNWERPHWIDGQQNFVIKKYDRGHQRVRLFNVQMPSGEANSIIDEKVDTFIYQNMHSRDSRLISGNKEIIWPSERTGWRHLYLYDTQTGQLKNAITSGNWVTREILKIDEEKRYIEFTATGLDSDQDPYFIHYCRVNLDGSGFTRLTDGDGTHKVNFAPNGKYLVDEYSRVDMPPVYELRNYTDGSLIMDIEKADASRLYQAGFCNPEPFSAKGRDNKTDIWGVIYRPTNLDESKMYPIIESIYAGPQDSHVPKDWANFRHTQILAELGFIVVQIDGMGTYNRSKAFHDVCWHNLADAGFTDRIAWIKSAAKKYSYMDISRVGIFGTSAGAQNALGGLLFHPEFYKVGVAACGCHDNRIDKRWWNEQWMGYPVEKHYEEQSNIVNAHKLKGKFQLVLGELDSNVPPESSYQVANALIKAKKDFDFVIIPGLGHSSGGEFGKRKRWDFFIKHLLGEETPDWNN